MSENIRIIWREPHFIVTPVNMCLLQAALNHMKRIVRTQNMLHLTGNLLFYSGNLVNNTLCVNICENGGKGDLSDIECGMVVVRQTLLTVSETADL